MREFDIKGRIQLTAGESRHGHKYLVAESRIVYDSLFYERYGFNAT